jgi:uncharacterized membrane protein
VSVLWGVAVLIVGMMLRVNPLAVVLTSALTTGWLAGITPLALLALIGENFRDKRFLMVFLLVLPLVATLESLGLREYLKRAMAARRETTLVSVLSSYFLVRQIADACGLTSLGGHPQSVRPLLVPLAESAAMQRWGVLKKAQLEKLKAFCAGTDNVALFFGEDVFLAFGAVLLIQATLKDYGIEAEALNISLWAIPTAILAAVIHLIRIRRFKL